MSETSHSQFRPPGRLKGIAPVTIARRIAAAIEQTHPPTGTRDRALLLVYAAGLMG